MWYGSYKQEEDNYSSINIKACSIECARQLNRQLKLRSNPNIGVYE